MLTPEFHFQQPRPIVLDWFWFWNSYNRQVDVVRSTPKVSIELFLCAVESVLVDILTANPNLFALTPITGLVKQPFAYACG